MLELQERNSYDTSKPHKHEYIEIFLFSKGGGTHAIDFKEYPIGDSSVHFVFPNQIHKVKRELDTHGHVVLISKEYFSDLDYELYVQFFHAFYLQPTLNLSVVDFGQVFGVLDPMKNELQSCHLFYQSIVKDYLHVLIKLFMRQRLNSNSIRGVNNKDFKLYMDLVFLVENQFIHHFPVSYFNETLQVSLRKLNTVCQKFHSTTCSGVVHDRIVLEAKKLLVHTDKSVKEVMFALNYKDAAYFNRFFKNKTGYTPSEYKSKNVDKYHK